MILLLLLWQFGVLSLMAVGGANVLLPELQRLVVEQGWMSAPQFAELFALAQAAPGPNVLVVSLIGWHVAGMAGALVSMLGMCLPSSLLSYYVSRWWAERKGSELTQLIARALQPLTVGLVGASACLLLQAANRDAAGWGLSLAVALIAWRRNWNPLWLLLLGGLIGGLGWL
ncbi:chromate transporter [Chromobacterium sphagni]|uniref:Chromate transporter n=1 Tax=Chromobacterium sphagni TaxID=1903179 RepID=A0A1S1X3S1_9NEIS|nr:chromate transporter [Chromobacterium sphagni]OHX14070.1 chromate transporter [Chromobacterium sphagni]OHX20277.1 chromate transporter [Chromobacterium sphagni]